MPADVEIWLTGYAEGAAEAERRRIVSLIKVAILAERIGNPAKWESGTALDREYNAALDRILDRLTAIQEDTDE